MEFTIDNFFEIQDGRQNGRQKTVDLVHKLMDRF